MSREDFEVLDHPSDPGKDSFGTRTSSSTTVVQTPRKDNRSGSQNCIRNSSLSSDLPRINSSHVPYLRQSWRSINIDSCANLRCFDGTNADWKSSHATETALYVLDDIQSIGIHGIPASTEISELLDENVPGNHTINPRLQSVLRRVRDSIVNESDGVEKLKRKAAVRQVAETWTPQELLENMKRIEKF